MTDIEIKRLALLGERWFKKINHLFEFNEMVQLGRILYSHYNQYKVHPTKDKMFAAFKAVEPDDVRVIVLGQDPYPHDHANGIAFATDLPTIPESLAHIFSEIDRTIDEPNTARMPDLKYLCEQGVLLLNSRLTVIHRQPGSHAGIGWESFIYRVLKLLPPTVPIVALGRDARDIVCELNNPKFEAKHPASASWNNSSWDCKNIFNRVNILLTDDYGEQPIYW